MIELANEKDLHILDDIAKRAIVDMQANNIPQWTLDYPREKDFRQDIALNQLYIVKRNRQIVGFSVIRKENDRAYQTIDTWHKDNSLVIHRLVVDPDHQHKGVGTELFTYAKKQCLSGDYESIKIDTHPDNYRMKALILKQGFEARGYLETIHRDAYEWVVREHIKDNVMKRVVILGASGTGKTTLCRMIANKYNLDMLHLDQMYWLKDWQNLSKEAFNRKMNHYLTTHHRWAIDGNYTNNAHFDKRLQLASTIIFLDYGTQAALKGIHERAEKYKYRTRSDMAEGCIEGIDQIFLQYVAFFDDKARKIKAYINQFKEDKNVLIFQSRQELMTWFNRH
ncbi:MAG: GNAT family N-acetyltransferase [Candidatus Izemoplasma sp.]|nr:GNAT family N-acetyltransferase [Candidatus Izemoplasma sp.]